MWTRLGPLVCLAGCFGQHGGGQIGEEGEFGCGPRGAAPLGFEEVSALGFAPADLAALAVPYDGPLTWADGATTGLRVEVEAIGPYELVDYADPDPAEGGTEAAFEAWCPDRVELGVRLTFRSDDGAFDEVLEGRLGSDVADAATLSLRLRDPSGTFDPADWAPEGDFDAVSATLSARWDLSGGAGRIDGQAEATQGDTASVQSFEIATWGPPLE
jgi:hypothetical protein